MTTLKYDCIKDFHMEGSTEETPDIPFVEGKTYVTTGSTEQGELLFINEQGEQHYMNPNASIEWDDYVLSEHLVPTVE